MTITSVKGWLIDIGKRTLIIQVNVPPVSNITGRPSREPETRTYPYAPELYEDNNILVTLIGERVKCTLEDGVVVKVESL